MRPAKKKSYYLAVDLGSTFFKAGIFDGRLRRIGVSERQLSYLHRDVHVDFAVDEAESAFKDAIEGALSASGIPAGSVAAIGVTSQAQTFAVTDGKSRFLTPFISWEDMRSKSVCDSMSEDPLFSDFHEHASFYSLLPNLQICQVKMLSDKEEIGTASEIIPLPSYLIKLLCGKAFTDTNIAAMSGFYSLKTGGWNLKYLSFCGLNIRQMPSLVRAGSVASLTGKCAARLGLTAGIPVLSCGNDQTAGAFGAGLGSGMILANLGSAQILYQRSPELAAPKPGVVRGEYPGGGYYRLLVGDFGGNLISRVISAGIGFKGFDGFFEAAAKTASASKPQPGTFEVRSNGTFSFDRKTPPGEIASSCLHYLCGSMKEMYEKMLAECAVPPRKILVAGGGSRNEVWVKMLESEIGKKLVKADADALHGTAKMLGFSLREKGALEARW